MRKDEPTNFHGRGKFESGVTVLDHRPGDRLFGHYTLQKEIGRGGMGVVWLALDENLDEEIALKLLPVFFASDRMAINDLKREARRTRKLSHPNIVRIHNFELDARGGGISMEYVDGDTLSNIRAERDDRALTIPEMMPIVRQLCMALTHAHEDAKIVHRDIKPANLMVTSTGQLKVADFGISSTLHQSTSLLTSPRAGGTLVYMGPQQVYGEAPSIADDIYALGATIYDLLTGRPPFYEGDVALQIRTKPPVSMRERREKLGLDSGDIPEEWESVVVACLEKEPGHRPSSAMEVARWLELVPGEPPKKKPRPAVQIPPPIPEHLVVRIETPPTPELPVARIETPPTPELPVARIETPPTPELPVPRIETPTTPELPVAHIEKPHTPELAVARIKTPPVPELPPTRPSNRKGIVVAILLLLLAAGGTAGWWYGYKLPLLELERRTAKIDAYLETARAAMDTARYEEARQAYRGILDLDKWNVTAEEGLREVERREEEARVIVVNHQKEIAAQKLREKIEAGLKAGTAALNLKQYGAARSSFQEVLKLDQENKDAKTGIDSAFKGEKDLENKGRQEREQAETALRIKVQIDEKLREAAETLKNGNLDAARKAYKAVQDMDEDNLTAKEGIARVDKESAAKAKRDAAEHVKNGRTFLKNGRLDDAATEAKEAQKYVSDDSGAKTLLADIAKARNPIRNPIRKPTPAPNRAVKPKGPFVDIP